MSWTAARNTSTALARASLAPREDAIDFLTNLAAHSSQRRPATCEESIMCTKRGIQARFSPWSDLPQRERAAGDSLIVLRAVAGRQSLYRCASLLPVMGAASVGDGFVDEHMEPHRPDNNCPASASARQHGLARCHEPIRWAHPQKPGWVSGGEYPTRHFRSHGKKNRPGCSPMNTQVGISGRL